MEGRSSDGKEFVLRPFLEFSDIAAGTTFMFHFVARQNGDQVPYATYTIEGKVIMLYYLFIKTYSINTVE